MECVFFILLNMEELLYEVSEFQGTEGYFLFQNINRWWKFKIYTIKGNTIQKSDYELKKKVMIT